MKRILVFLFSIALLTACGLAKKDHSNAGNSTRPAPRRLRKPNLRLRPLVM